MKKTLLFFVGALMSAYGHSQAQPTVFQDWKTSVGTQHFFYKNVTRTDGSGNVFVAGATQTAAGDYDILLAKFNSSGVQQWIRQIDGLAHYQDFATSIQLDGSGNIYIAGAITNDTVTHFSDMIVVKYNSSGTEQWRATYDGANLYDCGTDIFVATNGTVVVTGSSYNSSVNLDFMSISYNSSGVQQFASRFNHTSNMNDVPVRIIKSGSSVYISGAVQTGTGSYSWAEVKYNTSGVQQAVNISAGGTTGIEEVHAMVQDASGNLYLAGITPTLSNGYDYDIIKMDSSLNILWERTYDGADHLNDIANGIQVSASGDVYVTGASRTASAGDDYLTLKYNSSGSLIWSRTFNDTLNGNDVASSMVMDNSGKPVITGSAQTAMDGLDYYTMKYDTAGTVVWSIYYDGDVHLEDRATNIAIDTVGAVVVTGASETATGVYEYATVRYVEKNIITPTDFLGEKSPSDFAYYQNKGQIIGTDTLLSQVPRVKFYTANESPALYVMNDTLSMVFSSGDTTGTIDTLHRINISFPNKNPNAKVYPLEQQNTFLNYYLGQCPDGITQVHGNNKLIIPDIYPNIDLMYSSNQNGFKYYFIVKPGGIPSNIRMEYTGANATAISGNNLIISSLIGSITFDRPFSYQLNSTNDTVAGSGSYLGWNHVSGTIYNFALHSYDSTKTFIIEVDRGNSSVGAAAAIQNLDWSTYVSGNNEDGCTDITTDAAGNPYITGGTWSSNFPVGTSYQIYSAAKPNLLGSMDAFIMKFNKSNRQVAFASYLGGTGTGTSTGTAANDRANDIAAYKGTDATKNYVFITGTTWSTDFPVVHTDIFTSALSLNNSLHKIRSTVAAFRQSDGALKWSTCHGGTGTGTSEEGTSLDVDPDGTLVMGVMCTGISSPVSAPYVPLITPSGAYTKNDGSGMFILFDNNYQVKWCTLIGSIGGWVNDVKIVSEPDGRAAVKKCYITGKTAVSTGYPMDLVPNPNNEYYQSTFGGGSFDAYIAKVDIESTYALEYSTYWGGDGNDVGVAIEARDYKSIYFAGYTKSGNLTNTELPDAGAYHDITKSGASDGFLLKFDGTNGNTLEWGTLYGGNQNDVILDICIDNNDRVYATGETKSTSGFVQTSHSGFYNQTQMGNDGSATLLDGFIVVFDETNHDLHSSYFGGLQPDAGTGITTDGTDNVFICGSANSNEGTFPLVEFSTTSALDFYDGAYANNVTGPGFILDTYARTSGYTYDGDYEGASTANRYSDGYIASFGLQSVWIGVNDQPAANSQISLYPNPTSHSLTLSTDDVNLIGSTISITNVLGQIVQSYKLTEMNTIVDVSALNSGIYFIAIRNKASYISIKFIKE